MKTKSLLKSFAFVAVLLLAVSCTQSMEPSVGVRTDALDSSAWECSKWISVVDAPVVTIKGARRAADGANWFLTTVKNEQAVVSAKWMATSLGVHHIYINGKPVGEEFLRPGFTHREKTRHSYTYDITEAYNLAAGV